jgi:hypothetical protein
MGKGTMNKVRLASPFGPAARHDVMVPFCIHTLAAF